jgi:hypothetical protein
MAAPQTEAEEALCAFHLRWLYSVCSASTQPIHQTGERVSRVHFDTGPLPEPHGTPWQSGNDASGHRQIASVRRLRPPSVAVAATDLGTRAGQLSRLAALCGTPTFLCELIETLDPTEAGAAGGLHYHRRVPLNRVSGKLAVHNIEQALNILRRRSGRAGRLPTAAALVGGQVS